MELSLSSGKRFRVALSYASEHRTFVGAVAMELQQMLGNNSVFYDDFYKYDLARFDLDTHLLRIYRDQSELIVVFLCDQYHQKDWCGLEWRAVRDMIKSRSTTDIMPMAFGTFDASREGLLSIDNCFAIDSQSPAQIASQIVQRLEHSEAQRTSKQIVRITLDEDFDQLDEKRLEQLAKLLQHLLANNSIQIFSKRKGSVILTLLLSQDDANRLLACAENGELGVIKATSVEVGTRRIVPRRGVRASSKAAPAKSTKPRKPRTTQPRPTQEHAPSRSYDERPRLSAPAPGVVAADPFAQLFSKDYAHILALARSRLAKDRSPVSTLTLAHELYLNLRDRTELKFDSREQFLAYSSRAMRSLLVDMARERLSQKRSSELLPLTFGLDIVDGNGTPEQVLALDNALERLGKIDARLLKVAELRVILGMDIADTAAALGLSEPTVKRDWQRAKAYLYEQLGGVS